ncbi:MAG: hypothetical protein Ct9H300mP7_2470 [Verrucomicrobiota bacterium]|nr:MAG: hypothetical protein Ct9H300mP7_2470 [Verrucomicrobiota bacterium]
MSWDIYVPSEAEQQVAVTEFLANPTAKVTDGLYNPLYREVPSDSDRIPLRMNSSRLPILAKKGVDLAGWSLSDAVTLRSNFYDGDVLAKGGAVIV